MTGIGLLLAVATAVLDLETSPIKDQRNSTCRPDLGYAGCLTEVSLYNEAFGLWAYGAGIKETEKALTDCGAKFLRQWNALEEWQRGMAGEWNRSDPKVCFGLWKRLGIRILLTLELYSVLTGKKLEKRSGDVEVVKKTVGRFVEWLVRNKFKGVVAGFELGNEAYFGNDPEWYAGRCEAVIPEILKIWPEAKIGIPIAEYRAGDPDLDVVRRRLGEKKMMVGGGEFEINRFNQWSGRFIVAFSNCLHLCSHAIYHFYGGDIAYGVGPSGFARICNFAKVFPEVKDKRIWITEWRERSDEDNRCHLTHSSGFVKAHYMLSAICQPEIDGLCAHTALGLAGVINIADGRGNWYGQRDPGDNTGCGIRFYPDLDCTGHARLEVGPCGPMFRMYTEALLKHPLILEHGVADGGTITDGHYWSGPIYYDRTHIPMTTWLAMGADPAKKPRNTGNVDWVLTANPGRTSAALLVCNTKDVEWKPTFRVVGGKAGKPRVWLFRCREKDIWLHQTPGEPPPSWQEKFDGDPAAIVIPAYTMATLVFPIERAAK